MAEILLVGQADGQPLGRRPRPDGRVLARTDPGQQQIRAQFTDASTSPPWSLSWSGSPSRTKVDGIDQEPMGGTSFVHTFDAANAAERVIGWQ